MAMFMAVIPALMWGSIGLVSGKLGGTSYQQTLGMTFGALIFGAFSIFMFHPVFDTKIWLVGIASGLFWAVGQFQQFQSMKAIGISITMPVSTGLQLVFTTLAGVLLFHEWTTTRTISVGTLAMIVLIGGIVLTSRRDRNGQPASQGGSYNPSAGTRALIFSTIGYVLYTVVVQWSAVDSKTIFFPQSIGMVIGALLFAARNQPFGKPMVKNILTGIIWGIGNLFMFLAIPKVGLAISYSLSQMGIVISTFGSIFLLGEHKTRREMVYVTVGSLLVIAGGVLLGTLK
ncbi:GRP family sugar transporter [Secundilactobacillus kimchicus]|uniref:Glucose uptake permease n=1 Tax=Secundilactobacillus kimchicus JCM 15530 TaxID=1302272 RepID=A0A0R1HMV1_9LACO|nr:GRP family sugar transporter [Secundilactobacillus kimchicus]KRK48149.1 glucose uptake permease [Secundilactobacillus kimchicus JCM 15530]MBT9670899.1 glucose transporter GlcU [Secundilactobacillus kimchicus]